MQLKKATVLLLSIALIISVVVPVTQAGSNKKNQDQSTVYLKSNIHGTERYKGFTE